MSSSPKRLPRGSVAPCVVTFDANHDTSEPVGLRWVPADVTGVSINVKRPDGATAVWGASVYETRTNGITALHVLAAGEVNISGKYEAELIVSFAGGSLKSFKDYIQVVDSVT